jgi:CubicO group peptidase (beta-lactamase class C family)
MIESDPAHKYMGRAEMSVLSPMPQVRHILVPTAAFLILLGSSASSSAQPDSSSAVQTRIQHIENGIVPLVIIKGQAAVKVTLAERMAALHVPGVSIAVIHDGAIAWARGFGVSKVDGDAVTPDTLFQAGSISKPLTALAVLHLVQLGKLDLDTDVNRYLKTWKLPDNNFTEQKKVTLRELLSHTAGMTVHGFPGYASGAPVPTLVQVLNGEPPANTPAIRVDTVPGTLWRYSGGGYVVMQQVLGDLTGEPFPKLMHDVVLAPAGMAHSTYEQPLPAGRLAQAATPYDQNGKPIEGGAHTYPEMAPAGLWTTPSDLARYAIEVQNSLAGKSNRVLSKSMTAEMLKPGGLGNYGLGPHLGGDAANPYFDHGGADAGFLSNLFAYNHGDGVVIMTNSYSGGQLADELLRTIAHEYGWPDFQPTERTIVAMNTDVLNGYIGHYQVGRYRTMDITRNADGLVAQSQGQKPRQIFPANDRDWFFSDTNAQMSFDLDANRRATSVINHQNGVDTQAKRIDDAQAKQIGDELAAKVKNQSQDPLSEAALRRNIDELRRGEPNYDQMSPGLANITRQELSDLKGMINGLGELKSLTFKGVGPAGADIYDVAFNRGATEWRILLSADGKSESIGFRTIP